MTDYQIASLNNLTSEDSVSLLGYIKNHPSRNFLPKELPDLPFEEIKIYLVGLISESYSDKILRRLLRVLIKTIVAVDPVHKEHVVMSLCDLLGRNRSWLENNPILREDFLNIINGFENMTAVIEHYSWMKQWPWPSDNELNDLLN